MQKRFAIKSLTALSLALAAGSVSLPATAASSYAYAHHRYVHHARVQTASSDITVRKSAPRNPDYAHDAFHGPAAIITAPVEIAGTFVSLPFRALDVVFASRANDPRVLVGAPVHFAGQVAEFPFYAINGVFGVRPTHYTFN